MRHSEVVATLTIPSGDTVSNEVSETTMGGRAKLALGSAVDLIVYAPTTLPEVVTVQVSADDTPSSGDWKDLKVFGALVTIGADEAVVVPVGPARAFRLIADGLVGGDRDFVLMTQTGF